MVFLVSSEVWAHSDIHLYPLLKWHDSSDGISGNVSLNVPEVLQKGQTLFFHHDTSAAFSLNLQLPQRSLVSLSKDETEKVCRRAGGHLYTEPRHWWRGSALSSALNVTALVICIVSGLGFVVAFHQRMNVVQQAENKLGGKESRRRRAWQLNFYSSYKVKRVIKLYSGNILWGPPRRSHR